MHQKQKKMDMEELRKKAIDYAEENVINVLKETFAKVYADGYSDGYKDCLQKTPVETGKDQTVFVDLGLPSGTLWSSDFVNGDDKCLFIPYEVAKTYSIPTQEQCRELFKECNILLSKGQFVCVGPNGRHITFTKKGYKKFDGDDFEYTFASLFWIQSTNDNPENVARIVEVKSISKDLEKYFPGYRLPIRLVK